jgi:DNA polymerase III subunit delta
MTFQKIISDLQAKKYASIYFLMGEESYYIDLISDYIENNVLNEMEKEFNQHVMYGKDVDMGTVINVAKRFPMMAPLQVVIIKEAQNISDIEKLEYYLQKPLNSTILVICYKYKTLDKRKKIYKMLSESGVVFNSEKLRDYQISDWIGKYCQSQKISISPKSAQMLAEFLGTDLSKIVNEIEKLQLVMPKGSNEINPALIEEYIGISKDFNAFELQEAIAARDVLKANRIVNYFNANQKTYPIQMVLVPIFNFFANLLVYHYNRKNNNDTELARIMGIIPFFLKQYSQAARNYNAWKCMETITMIRTYDAKSKGFESSSTTTGGDLLKELVYKIMH